VTVEKQAPIEKAIQSTSRRIAIASQNPVKSAAIAGAYQQLFPGAPFEIEKVSVASGVADQPMSDAETLRGARNRAEAARRLAPHVDLWAGLEGGVEDRGPEAMFAFAWIVVLTSSTRGEARTATFPIPELIARLIREGVELGHAMDRIFDRQDTKSRGGAIGILTHGIIDRSALYEHAAIMALIPLKQHELFGQQ
jgi:inosine/xanthosine triphosphatase